MLVEFSIIPIGSDAHTSEELAEALKLVDASGLPYQLNPAGTCVEGDWDEVLQLVHRCHQRVREKASHVVTMVKIEDDAGERGKLHRNVASVEEKAGRPLQRTGDPAEQRTDERLEETP